MQFITRAPGAHQIAEKRLLRRFSVSMTNKAMSIEGHSKLRLELREMNSPQWYQIQYGRHEINRNYKPGYIQGNEKKASGLDMEGSYIPEQQGIIYFNQTVHQMKDRISTQEIDFIGDEYDQLEFRHHGIEYTFTMTTSDIRRKLAYTRDADEVSMDEVTQFIAANPDLWKELIP